MPKEEWGVKRICPTTGKRFYDLNRNPIVSPYTGEVVTLETTKAGRSLLAEKPSAASAAKASSVLDDDDLVLEDDDLVLEDDDSDLDDDLLEDDDDDNVSLDDIADVSADDED